MARGHLEMVAAWVPAGCARDTRGACPGWLRAAIARLAFPFYGHDTPPLTTHGVRCVGEGGVGRSTGWGEGGV